MKKLSMLLAATLLTANVFAQSIGIGSGQPSGTNYPMIEDVKKICSNDQHIIRNVTSDGSLDNLFKIYEDKTVQYGIVQVDALVYQQGLDPNMMSKIMMVFPFFSTEIHVIVKDSSSINSLSDLAGKKVVEGPEGSGTWVTVQVIKALTGIKWQAIQASQKDGLNFVKNNQADAEFIVAGKPIGLLKDQSGIKLLALNHPALDKFGLYTKTMITNSVYSFQKQSIQTYKVDNVLATYAFKNQYQKEIGDLVGCIAKNVGMMQTTTGFHEKWRDVDVTDINRIKWQAHPAAVAAIKRVSQRTK